VTITEDPVGEFRIEAYENKAFHIEQRGIDYIPHEQRTMRPRELAGLWAGAILNVEYLVYGALIVSVFGLSLPEAIIVILIGNLSFVMTALGSIQGARAGTATFVISRASFGTLGARLVSFFNWLTLVGFEVTGLGLVVLAGEALAEKAGFDPGTPLKAIFIVIAVLLQTVLPAFGHATMVKVLKMLTIPFIAIFAVLAIYTLPKAHFTTAHGASWETVFVALALVISASGLGWGTGSDYARYMPHDAKPGSIIAPVLIGSAIPSVLLMLLGAALGTAIPSQSTAVGGATTVTSGWFAVIYLIFIIVQLMAINTLDLYSSGLSLQAVGLKISRYQAVLVDTVLCTGLTFVAIFSTSFNTFLSDFLLFIIIWLAPWFSIYLVDWLLRREGYHTEDLLRPTGGRYWAKAGWNPPGVIGLVLGMVASACCIDTTPWVGPISRAANGADFSTFAGVIVGGGVYYVLARTKLKQPAPSDAATLEPIA
jgi:NCS1 nucleoside transporter family